MSLTPSESGFGSWLPRGRDLVDACFVVALVVLSAYTLGSTFTASWYLVVAAVGAVAGVLTAHVCTMARLPAVFVPLVVTVVFFLLGPAVTLGGDPAGGRVPTLRDMGELGTLALHGWSQLLTTLPPLDGSGPLLVLPFMIGLGCAALGMTLAGRTISRVAPLAGPLVALAAAILLGLRAPGSTRVVGVGFAVLTLGWLAVRSNRRIVQTHQGVAWRLTAATAVLAVGAGAVALAAPQLPGVGDGSRTVLRSHVTPPLHLSAFASPLVGFRKYRPAADELADQTLFTVRGLPAGYPMRIATLDDYDGKVWTVSNAAAAPGSADAPDTFQRAGATIATTESGPSATVHVTIGAAYADGSDTSGWLPDAGATTAIAFAGADRGEHEQDLRYNLATGTAVVPDRLQAGDSYTLSAVLPAAATAPVPAAATPYPGTSLDPSVYAFVATAATKWAQAASGGTGSTGSSWGRLLAIARYLRTNGAYSDGESGGVFSAPGHSTGRLTTFINGAQPIGDDEQYAATFALMANDLGIPARIVLGAVPEAGGVVKGADVHAWVEVRVASGEWLTVPRSTFMPPTTKVPKKQNPKQTEDSQTSVVPPPNSVRPPSSLEQLSQTGSNSSRHESKPTVRHTPWHLPGYVLTSLRWTGSVLGVIVLLAGLIITVKAARWRLRRRRGAPGVRVELGWREILDRARDLGEPVRGGLTRREQAGALAPHAVLALAERADDVLFGPVSADASVSAEYCRAVSRARREMYLDVSRWRRFTARISIRSLRPLASRPARTADPQPAD